MNNPIRQTFWVDRRGRISLARFGLRDCDVLIERAGEGVVIRKIEVTPTRLPATATTK